MRRYRFHLFPPLVKRSIAAQCEVTGYLRVRRNRLLTSLNWDDSIRAQIIEMARFIAVSFPAPPRIVLRHLGLKNRVQQIACHFYKNIVINCEYYSGLLLATSAIDIAA